MRIEIKRRSDKEEGDGAAKLALAMEQLPESWNFSYLLMESIPGSGFPLETCTGVTGGQMAQTLPTGCHSTLSRLLCGVRALGREPLGFGLLLFLCSFKLVSNTDIRRRQAVS